MRRGSGPWLPRPPRGFCGTRELLRVLNFYFKPCVYFCVDNLTQGVEPKGHKKYKVVQSPGFRFFLVFKKTCKDLCIFIF